MSDANASIDDLLRHEEEPPPEPQRVRTGGGWWLRTALMAGALAAVTVFLLRSMAELTVSIPLAYAGFLALLLLRRVVALVAAPPQAKSGLLRAGGEESGSYNWLASQDALRVAVHRWEVPLSRREDHSRFRRTVLPMLRELADERLRQRHGLTIASDPKSARVLLGDELWTLLTTPVKRPPAPRDLAASVSRLEKL